MYHLFHNIPIFANKTHATMLYLFIALFILSIAALLIYILRTLPAQRDRTAKAEAEANLIRQNYEQAEARYLAEKQETENRHVAEKQEAEARHLSEKQEAEKRYVAAQQEAEARHEREKTTLREQYAQQLAQQEARHNEQIAQQEARHQQDRQRQQEQWKEQLNTLKLQFDKLTQDHLTTQREALKQQNSESITLLINPLKQSVDTFSQQFATTMKTQGERGSVMEEAVKALSQQTQRLDKTTDNLTNALRGSNKTQGNWGEEVLANILENSGLVEGRDFTTQASVTDEGGRRSIPDVVVHLGEHPSVIIDSKASLTAYFDYVEAEDEISRTAAAKAHVASVRTHVRELVSKNYPAKIKGAQNYVLMFIPNEGSYILAVNSDAKLTGDAYRQGVILVNPTNLMLALRLVYLFGQSEKQAENVNTIILEARKLYEKFATFSKSFADIGSKVNSLSATYATAEGQLLSGRFNFARQLEGWKDKGLITNSQIDPRLLEEEG